MVFGGGVALTFGAVIGAGVGFTFGGGVTFTFGVEGSNFGRVFILGSTLIGAFGFGSAFGGVTFGGTFTSGKVLGFGSGSGLGFGNGSSFGFTFGGTLGSTGKSIFGLSFTTGGFGRSFGGFGSGLTTGGLRTGGIFGRGSFGIGCLTLLRTVPCALLLARTCTGPLLMIEEWLFCLLWLRAKL